MAAAGSSTPPRRAFGSGASAASNSTTNAARRTDSAASVAKQRPESITSFAQVVAAAQQQQSSLPLPKSSSSGTLSAPQPNHPPHSALGSSPGSVSSVAFVGGRERSTSNSSTGAIAVERASQWLSALAPRGEGRGREFLTSTLSGVATVASTVGQEVNGFINRPPGGGHSRPNSFSASSPPDGVVPVPRTRGGHARRDSAGAVTALGLQRTISPVPLNANGNGNGNGAAGGRRIPQPANMSRLGGGASHQSLTSHTSHTSLTSPLTSPTQGTFHRTAQHSATLPPPTSSSSSSSTPRPTSPSALSTTSTGTATGPAPRRGSHHRANSLGAVGALATSPALSAAGTGRVRAAGMPYKIGFQPSGVRSDRTAEFMMERRTLSIERDKEEGRLGRRWAKLVDLHFNPNFQTPIGAAAAGLTRSPSSSNSLTGALDSFNPKEVWKGLKMATGPNPEEARKRATEQGIVKWEDDADVKKCRICQASFSLSTRKHHCRLCGRIVCSLPPTPPALLAVQMQLFAPADAGAAHDLHTLPVTAAQAALPPGTRREKCSLLLVADWKTGRGEEVDEGFVGWMTLEGADEKGDPAIRNAKKRAAAAHARRASRDSNKVLIESRASTPLPQQPLEVPVHGVRCCRECWTVVSRKHKIAERSRTTPFTRLYVALRAIQSEIDSVLPEFEEQLAAHQQSGKEDAEPDDDLLDAHKHLVALLGQYDVVAKRIANLPCAEGGSQGQVQAALARSAATVLARAMASIQELPKLQRRAAAARQKNMVVIESSMSDVLKAGGVREDEAEDVAQALQPLLEQQAQLESFIAEANAQRKYDDSRSLAAALSEIEAEIARLTASALK